MALAGVAAAAAEQMSRAEVQQAVAVEEFVL